MTLEDRWDELNEEQRERARQLASPEELLEFAREIGTELSDADLEAVAGGGWRETFEPCMEYALCKKVLST